MTRILTGEYRQTLPDQLPAPFLRGRVMYGVSALELDFLIDTGAEVTVLSPADASNLFGNQAHRLLPRLYPSIHISGVGQGKAVEVPLTLVFRDQDEDPLYLRLPVLVMPSPQGPSQSSALGPLPSLLGRDILNRFVLILNPATETVELTELDVAEAG